MIYALTRLQIMFLFLQTLHVLFEPPKLISYVYFVLALMLLTCYLLLNSIIFTKPLQKIIYIDSKWSYIAPTTILAGGAVLIYSVVKEIIVPLPLSSLQHINNLGIAYKAACTILPVVAICVLESNLSRNFKIFIFLSCIIASGAVSVFVLSKMPLAPYFLYFIYFALTGKLPVRNLIIFALFLLPPVFAIYDLRAGENGEEANILTLIVYRVPLLIEMQNVIIWTLNNSPMFDFNVFEAPLRITKDVFEGDEYTGIAPSYLGYFIIQFGFVLGIVFSSLFALFVAKFTSSFNRANLIDKIIYYSWSIELFHFFLDGSLTFYTSTNSGAFFWGLLLLSVARLFSRIVVNVPKRRGYVFLK